MPPPPDHDSIAESGIMQEPCGILVRAAAIFRISNTKYGKNRSGKPKRVI
jgi:hypothetical protein